MFCRRQLLDPDPEGGSPFQESASRLSGLTHGLREARERQTEARCQCGSWHTVLKGPPISHCSPVDAHLAPRGQKGEVHTAALSGSAHSMRPENKDRKDIRHQCVQLCRKRLLQVPETSQINKSKPRNHSSSLCKVNFSTFSCASEKREDPTSKAAANLNGTFAICPLSE